MVLDGRLALHVRGARSPDEVWESYARPSLWSTWSPQIRRVEVPEDRLRVGLRGRVFSYAPLGVPFEVLAVDEVARTWRWVVRPGPVEVRLDHAVRADGGQTVTDLVLHGPWPVIALYAPLATLALRRLVR